MASSIHSAKIKDGDRLIEEGEKCLKTSLFKWTPNYDGAAQAFSKAAVSYKLGKAYDKAEKAYVRSAEAYVDANSLFYSAKALEDAAVVCKDSKRLDDAVKYFRNASHRYNENGNPDTAGMVMEKAAKVMELSEPDKAAVLYMEVAKIHEIEEKYREVSNTVRKALNMFIRSKQLSNAIKAADRLQSTYEQLQGWNHMHQVTAVKVLLYLHNGDQEEADQVYKEAFSVIGFDSSDEAAVIERLLAAFGEGDEEEITKCTTDPVYKCMDNEVAKLAKSLKPTMMDLNVAPLPSQTKRQQSTDQPTSSSDQPATSSGVSAADERAQLFTVTKPKKKQLPEDTGVMAGEDNNKTSEPTAPTSNVVDDVVKSPVEEEETVSDEEEEEILDIN